MSPEMRAIPAAMGIQPRDTKRIAWLERREKAGERRAPSAESVGKNAVIMIDGRKIGMPINL